MLKKAVGLKGALILQALDHPEQLFAISPPHEVFFFSFVCFSYPFTLSFRLYFSEPQTRTGKKKCLSTCSHVPGENGKQRLFIQLLRELSVTLSFLLELLLCHSLSGNKVEVANVF